MMAELLAAGEADAVSTDVCHVATGTSGKRWGGRIWKV